MQLRVSGAQKVKARVREPNKEGTKILAAACDAPTRFNGSLLRHIDFDQIECCGELSNHAHQVFRSVLIRNFSLTC